MPHKAFKNKLKIQAWYLPAWQMQGSEYDPQPPPQKKMQLKACRSSQWQTGEALTIFIGLRT